MSAHSGRCPQYLPTGVSIVDGRRVDYSELVSAFTERVQGIPRCTQTGRTHVPDLGAPERRERKAFARVVQITTAASTLPTHGRRSAMTTTQRYWKKGRWFRRAAASRCGASVS
ncbi:hypothetical protein C1S80_15360 [Mycolicibacterium aubagnense]|nr:hypothetical protein C1S80_15360 [Mycolicibacterium aubagnense]